MLDYMPLQTHIPAKVFGELQDTCVKCHLNNPLRLAHFLAQCAHESLNFKVVEENLNYSEMGLRNIFPKYFTDNGLARKYAHCPEHIASKVYANRMGNGNELSGDGWKYRGRGYIQLTGRDNYALFNSMVVDDVLANPDLVATKYPLLSAAWFWDANRLNIVADGGAGYDVVKQVTKVVNGGYRGLDDRVRKFNEFNALL